MYNLRIRRSETRRMERQKSLCVDTNESVRGHQMPEGNVVRTVRKWHESLFAVCVTMIRQ